MHYAARATLQNEGLKALTMMEEALDLLDACDAATAVGAHLDLAICRLRDALATAGVEQPPPSLRLVNDEDIALGAKFAPEG